MSFQNLREAACFMKLIVFAPKQSRTQLSFGDRKNEAGVRMQSGLIIMAEVWQHCKVRNYLFFHFLFLFFLMVGVMNCTVQYKH